MTTLDLSLWIRGGWLFVRASAAWRTCGRESGLVSSAGLNVEPLPSAPQHCKMMTELASLLMCSVALSAKRAS